VAGVVEDGGRGGAATRTGQAPHGQGAHDPGRSRPSGDRTRLEPC